ncbi:MAG: helix-turn-helix transcriptional regulator [Actinomycetota bacterium]|nr:helix-turn-helix transcriptional regulator [Actinomycetota bacterium]
MTNQEQSKDKSTFGERLKDLRIEAGFDCQKQLAEAMRCHGPEGALPGTSQLVKQISRWETGAHHPLPFYIELLCTTLKCKRSDLEPNISRRSQGESGPTNPALIDKIYEVQKTVQELVALIHE